MMKIKTVMFAALLASSAIARADGDAEYKRGQAAMKAGRVHEACDAFAASDKSDPNADTELALAACYEQDGKPVAAARIYRWLAEKDGNLERRKQSSDKVAKLESRAAKLRLLLTKRPDGLAIFVDGQQVPSTGDVLVDAGPHEVIATAPGYEGHANAPVDRDRATLDVIVRMEPKTEPAPVVVAPAPAPAAEPEPAAAAPVMTHTLEQIEPAPVTPMSEATPSHRKRNGVIIGAVGLAVGVGAVVFFGASSGKFDDEHALCPHMVCSTSSDLATGNSLRSDARTDRGVALGMGVGAVALIGAGAYMMLTHKEPPAQVSLDVTHGNTSLTFTHSF
jgi:hypothetical protein